MRITKLPNKFETTNEYEDGKTVRVNISVVENGWLVTLVNDLEEVLNYVYGWDEASSMISDLSIMLHARPEDIDVC